MSEQSEQNFAKKFDLFISHMWHLQDRVDELKEFEKQLESLFCCGKKQVPNVESIF